MLNKMKEAYVEYINQGYSTRSSAPANIMHDAIKEFVNAIIAETGLDYLDIRTSNFGGEYPFSSDIHEKKIDVTVIDRVQNKPVIAISFKMPMSSVNKNLKNYFEMNIGDATLVKDSGTPFYFFMVLDENSIKFSSSQLVMDDISQKSIQPFSKVMKAQFYASYRPNQMFITKVDFGDREHKLSFQNRSATDFKNHSEEHIRIIDEHTPTATVYKTDESWDDDFEGNLELLRQSLKLEILLYDLRKKL